MRKRGKYTKNKSILFIPKSKDRSIKVTYDGKKGKECIFFNSEKLSCECSFSMNYKRLCISHKCKEFKHK